MSKDYARQRLMQIDLAKASDPSLWYSERVGDPGPYENGENYIDVMLEARQKASHRRYNPGCAAFDHPFLGGR